MPSTMLFPQSGGIALVSGAIFSGTLFPIGGVQLKLAKAAPGIVYVGVTNLSGLAITSLSGGSLSSGGLTDGMEMSPGDAYFIPKCRLVSGIESITCIVPAASSGSRLFWEYE
jgi:hypothetical protein